MTVLMVVVVWCALSVVTAALFTSGVIRFSDADAPPSSASDAAAGFPPGPAAAHPAS